jgi:hypothetical protein
VETERREQDHGDQGSPLIQCEGRQGGYKESYDEAHDRIAYHSIT